MLCSSKHPVVPRSTILFESGIFNMIIHSSLITKANSGMHILCGAEIICHHYHQPFLFLSMSTNGFRVYYEANVCMCVFMGGCVKWMCTRFCGALRYKCFAMHIINITYFSSTSCLVRTQAHTHNTRTCVLHRQMYKFHT